MVCLCVGFKNINVKTKEGDRITGVRIYFTTPIDADADGDGVECDSCFVSSNKYQRYTFVPKIGDQFIPVYNRYGKIQDFDKA